MLPKRATLPMAAPESAEEHLRRALLDLQAAQLQFARSFADPQQAAEAAREADEARSQAAHWASIARQAVRIRRLDE